MTVPALLFSQTKFFQMVSALNVNQTRTRSTLTRLVGKLFETVGLKEDLAKFSQQVNKLVDVWKSNPFKGLRAVK